MDTKQPDKKEAAAIKRRAIADFTLYYYLHGPEKDDEAASRRHAKMTIHMLQLFDKMSPEDQEYALWLLEQMSAQPDDGDVVTAVARFNSAKTKAAKSQARDELRALYEAGQALNG